MAKVYFNKPLDFINEVVWSACNGATRRELKVINKIKKAGEQINCVNCQLGFLDRRNHSFIFMNEPKPEDNRILGLFLNNSYSYDLVEGKEIYSNYSAGGYGNSCSSFGIYEVGTLLKVHTYKNRNAPSYYKLTADGWKFVENYEVEQSEINEV